MRTQLALLAMVLVPGEGGAAQAPYDVPFLPESYEIALARSAAPAAFSDSADVWVLRADGYERLVRGTSGAACLVARDHPLSRYPICYDPEAARTLLPRIAEEYRLRRLGLPEDSVQVLVDRAYEAKQLEPPARTAIAYMMSRHQVIYAGRNGRRVGAWHPHLMIYMPGATVPSLAMRGLPDGDLTLSRSGEPDAHFVVMTRDWAVTRPLPPLAQVDSTAPAHEPGWICPGDHYRITAETSVHPERMEHNLVRDGAACAGRLSVTSMAIAPARASDSIRPRAVTNRGDRAVSVTHRGTTVRLAPGETTHAFDAAPFSGDWGVVVDTGASNPYCPPPGSGERAEPAAPRVDLLIITACP